MQYLHENHQRCSQGIFCTEELINSKFNHVNWMMGSQKSTLHAMLALKLLLKQLIASVASMVASYPPESCLCAFPKQITSVQHLIGAPDLFADFQVPSITPQTIQDHNIPSGLTTYPVVSTHTQWSHHIPSGLRTCSISHNIPSGLNPYPVVSPHTQ